VDKGLKDEAWRDFPRTVMIHMDRDATAPYQGSAEMVGVISKNFIYERMQ